MNLKVPKTKKSDDENTDESEKKEKLPNEVLVIAQEVKIINALASNDLTQRTKQLKKLRRWLSLRSNSSFPFANEDFLRIWKGLYYTMWMSDKPLVQEELAEDLGKLINCFSDVKYGVQFFGAFLKTMCREWFGVDQWRMDKFLMLIRRMVRYVFCCLKKDNWSSESIKEFNTLVFETILAENTALGITMHFIDVFFDELAKVSDGELSAKTVALFIKPFVKLMAHQNDDKILVHCRNKVFYHLLFQSELGREYTEKYNAWKEMGFPTESIDDLEKVDELSEPEEVSENVKNEKSKNLDPRAGNVDVYIPLLPLDGKYVIKEIENVLYKAETSTRSRKILKTILEKYKMYDSGKFPLGVKRMPKIKEKCDQPLILSKLKALENLENDMYSTSRKLKKLNKRKRRKLLASLNFKDTDENNFENLIEKSLPKPTENVVNIKKRKSVPSMSWVEEDLDKEVTPVKLKKKNEVERKVKAPKLNENKKIQKKLKKDIQKPEQPKEPTISDKTTSIIAPVLVTSEPTPPPVNNLKKEQKIKSEWDEPLREGETEYFVPSKKIQLKEANEKFHELVPNPFANIKQQQAASPKTPKNNTSLGKKPRIVQSAKLAKDSNFSAYTPPKRVKIVLQRNTMQNPSEYIKQIKSSPSLPFDATKKPSKGLLKPHSVPSPINPFYKRKIGLKLLNDTL